MEGDWPVRKSSLAESLGHIFSTGFYSDVAFLVGEEEFKINAHKTILSARSEPLAAMFHERWISAKEQEIRMPQNNPTAVKHFLKFLYTDEISFGNVGMEDILEITHFAHMYQVHKLLGQCISHITANISESNCLQIYKSFQLLSKTLSDKALQFFLANVVPTAKWNDAYLSWDYDTMEKILLDDREHVPEPILFRALLRWINVDSARNAMFQNLIKLIRFPTMSPKDFASEVVTSGVLTKDEIVEVFSYIATQTGTVSFPTKCRKSFASVDEPKLVKICGGMRIYSISAHSFLQMAGPPERNFHKFGLKFESHFLPDMKLYGVKFYNHGVNNADLMSYLESKHCKIKLTAEIEDDGEFGVGSKVIEKTITELNQCQTQAYFDSPLLISRNQGYSITTNITPGAGIPTTYYANDDHPVRVTLPHLASKREQPLVLDGISRNLMIEPLEWSYSLIEELIFSPPSASDDCSDCKIS